MSTTVFMANIKAGLRGAGVTESAMKKATAEAIARCALRHEGTHVEDTEECRPGGGIHQADWKDELKGDPKGQAWEEAKGGMTEIRCLEITLEDCRERKDSNCIAWVEARIDFVKNWVDDQLAIARGH